MGRIAMVVFIGFFILLIITASMGCNSEEGLIYKEPTGGTTTIFERKEVKDQPPREFKEKCEITYKAFHIFKDSEGRWSCKLDDGRVFNEDNIK